MSSRNGLKEKYHVGDILYEEFQHERDEEEFDKEEECRNFFFGCEGRAESSCEEGVRDFENRSHGKRNAAPLERPCRYFDKEKYQSITAQETEK